MLTIVFYGNDGPGAKRRAKEIQSGRDRAVVYDVTAWDGTKDGADSYEIVGDISYFDRQRIEHVFVVKEDAIRDAIADLACGNGVEFDPTQEEKPAEREGGASENLRAGEMDQVIKKKRGRKPKAVEAN